jgi:hypothetical protein
MFSTDLFTQLDHDYHAAKSEGQERMKPRKAVGPAASYFSTNLTGGVQLSIFIFTFPLKLPAEGIHADVT